jgi:5-methylcytosine-specific restriction enzyme subunit McrC
MARACIGYSFDEQQSLSSAKSKNRWVDKNEQWTGSIRFSASQKIEDIVNLGLAYFNNELYASYYIGIDWITCENPADVDRYIVVHPKIKDLDYVKMFVHCLEHPEISGYLKDVYHFDFKNTNIQLKTDYNWEFTPFMIVHFLALVEQITKQGLKKNYITVDENLQGKIKGKIIFAQQIKKNIVAKRDDRISCRFQEYSVNCLENRLLKKTLLFIQRYSNHHLAKEYKELIQKESKLLTYFENVADEISFPEIQRVKVNALYKEYVEAVELAKQILKHFGYSYKKAGDKVKELPPFRIDMSKLFELYVYSLLEEAYPKSIQYQEHGKYGYVDFLKKDEELIIDAKYKKIYDSEKNEYEIDDIRQLAGYARDEGILNKLEISDKEKVVDCIIIYPNQNSEEEDFEKDQLKGVLINGFTKFYKCGIRLPVKK